jgi:hypothetical protein
MRGNVRLLGSSFLLGQLIRVFPKMPPSDDNLLVSYSWENWEGVLLTGVLVKIIAQL